MTGIRINAGGWNESGLTDRHLEIERRIQAGERQIDIARSLGISARAVTRAWEKIENVRSVEAIKQQRRQAGALR